MTNAVLENEKTKSEVIIPVTTTLLNKPIILLDYYFDKDFDTVRKKPQVLIFNTRIRSRYEYNIDILSYELHLKVSFIDSMARQHRRFHFDIYHYYSIHC